LSTSALFSGWFCTCTDGPYPWGFATWLSAELEYFCCLISDWKQSAGSRSHPTFGGMVRQLPRRKEDPHCQISITVNNGWLDLISRGLLQKWGDYGTMQAFELHPYPSNP
jgi:hypothetical protein